MSGDLEDFLRRAAQRRQAKAAGQAQSQPAARRPAAQYSDSRREREITPIEELDEVLTAEVVQDDDRTSIAARMKRLAEAKQAAEAAERAAEAKMREAHGMLSRQELVKQEFTGNPVHDLIVTLGSPGGLQQAILMREILDRPEHRW